MSNGKIYLVKTAHSYSRIPASPVVECTFAVRKAESADHAMKLVQGTQLWDESEHVLDVTELYEWYMSLGDNMAWFGNVCLLQSEVVSQTPSEKLREY